MLVAGKEMPAISTFPLRCTTGPAGKFARTGQSATAGKVTCVSARGCPTRSVAFDSQFFELFLSLAQAKSESYFTTEMNVEWKNVCE